MAPRISQRDIARHLGVHVTTVSLALRRHPSIPVKTRERVEEAARNLGYRPDPALTALMAYRRRAAPASSGLVLGYLTYWPGCDDWRKYPALARFFQGAQKRATDLGYKLEHIWLRRPGITLKRWNQILRARNLAGLILAPPPMGRGHLRLAWQDFHAVRIDSAFLWPPLHSVGNNQLQVITLAMRQVYLHGYRRIGFAMDERVNQRVARLYSAGYLDEQERLHHIEKIPMLLTSNWNKDVFLEWLAKYKPSVVISTDFDIKGWIEASGLKIPEEIGFIDLDIKDATGKCAGVFQNHEDVGALAVDTVISLMNRNERGIPKKCSAILVEGAWVQGRTIRNLRTNAARNDKTERPKLSRRAQKASSNPISA
jgi:LacI family transcriptional regulator